VRRAVPFLTRFLAFAHCLILRKRRPLRHFGTDTRWEAPLS
jgi:hypothetical protein